MKTYVIGAGGHSHSVCSYISGDIVLIDDSFNTNATTIEYFIENFTGDGGIFIAMGDNSLRKKIYTKIKEKYSAKYFINVVASDSLVQQGAQIKDNASIFIGSGAYVSSTATINSGAIINTKSIIEHDVKVDSFSQISPGAVVCGNVKIGKSAFIGANSVLIQNINIADNTIIGAGSVVINSLTKGKYVGNPIRKLEEK